MYSNYIKLALRNMTKNRLYAFINITGLAIGLAVFLFGSILASYERDHDSMFSKRERIFTAGACLARARILAYWKPMVSIPPWPRTWRTKFRNWRPWHVRLPENSY